MRFIPFISINEKIKRLLSQVSLFDLGVGRSRSKLSIRGSVFFFYSVGASGSPKVGSG